MNRIKLLPRILLVFALQLCSLLLFSQQNKPYLFKGDSNYPPFEFIDRHGQPTGFNVDLLRALCEVSHLNIKIELGSWNKVYRQLVDGEIDGITGMYRTNERDSLFLFSNPHSRVSYVIITRPAQETGSPDEIKNKTLVVQENDIAHQFLIENAITKNILTYDTPLLALQNFVAGKGDAVLVSLIHAYYFLDELKIESYHIIPLSPNIYNYCFALHPRDPDLQARINEGMLILQKTGKYQELKQKWFNRELAENMPQFLPEWWKYLALFLVLLAIGFIVWNSSLSKKLTLQTHRLKSELNAKTQAEKQLRTVLERLTIAQRSAGIGIWELNLKNMDLYWDDGMFELYEKDCQTYKASYDDWLLALLPDDSKTIQNAFDACIKNKTDFNAVFRITTPSGKQKYIRAFAKFTFLKNGEPVKAIGVNWDVTKIHEGARINEVLHSISQATVFSENLVGFMDKIRQELSHVVDTTNFFIGLVEEKTGNLYLPYMKDNVEEFDYFPIKNSISNYVIQQKKSMHFFAEDLETLHKKGIIERAGGQAKVWLGVPLQIENQVIGLIVLQSYTNKNAITREHAKLLEHIAPQLSLSIRRKKIQDELVASEEALRNITEQLKEAQVIAQMGNFEWNEKTKVFTFSDEIYHIFGVEKNDENSDFEVFKALIHPSDRDDLLLVITKASKNNIPFETECRIFNQDTGEPRIIILKGQPCMKNKVYNGVFSGILQDITDQKELEYEMKAAKEKAEQSDKLKSAFLANMSHEIRTPMNSILGFSQILGDADTQDELERYINIINKNGEHLLKLIDDIIDISKVETGLLTAQEDITDLDSLAETTLFQFNEYEKVKNDIVKLKLNKPEKEVGVILCDRTKIKQVLINLIYNALKFTQTGYIELRYTITHNQTLKFDIEDTGIGIPRDKLTHIFDRFMQVNTNEVSKSTGAGLGLSLCKSYTKLMGGEIWVKSTPGKGSTFSFEIPFSLAEAVVMADTPANNIANTPKTKPLILIAEDDEDSFLYFETIMLKHGYNFIHVENGKEAVEVCKINSNIDLVMMDIRMPVMDGLMATRKIKSFKKTLPIIAQTAHAMDGDSRKALDAGCDDYISKPVKREMLIEKINQWIPATKG